MRRDDICLYLSPADRAKLEAIVADRNSQRKCCWRAGIVLATADGLGTSAIMRRTGNQITAYIARRSVESGGRQDNYSSDSIRQVAGVKGAINDVWNYDAYGQVGITRLGDIEGNFLGTPPNPVTVSSRAAWATNA